VNNINIISFVLILFLFSCSNRSIELGNKNLVLGDYQRAVHLFSTAVDRNPNSFDARLGLGKALLQQLGAGSQNDELWNGCIINLEAARTLNTSAEVEKLLSAAWNQRAAYKLELKDSTGAIHSLLKSIEYDKSNIKSLNLAGILYYNRNEFKKALSMFSLVTHFDSLSPTGDFNKGMIYWAGGDCKSAKSAWKSALGKSPLSSDLSYWIALSDSTCPE
jgi:tetratricopeptide (TPR) repeat protein